MVQLSAISRRQLTVSLLKQRKQNNICRILGLTYTSYPLLTRWHLYLKRLEIQHEIKIHALLKSEF